MQIAELIILLLLGMIGGIISTVMDISMVGTSAVFMHFVPWVLINVLFAVHISDLKRTIVGSLALNFGLIETAIVTTAFTYENVSKKAMGPAVLLVFVGALICTIAWAARRESRTVFGMLLSLILGGLTLFACDLLYGAIGFVDYVCIGVMLLILIFIPTKRLRILPHVEEEPHPRGRARTTSRERRGENMSARSEEPVRVRSRRRKPATSRSSASGALLSGTSSDARSGTRADIRPEQPRKRARKPLAQKHQPPSETGEKRLRSRGRGAALLQDALQQITDPRSSAEQPSTNGGTRKSKPRRKASSKPAARPSARKSTQSGARAARSSKTRTKTSSTASSRPAARKNTRPSAKPSMKPSTRPSTKPSAAASVRPTKRTGARTAGTKAASARSSRPKPHARKQ
ncbi:MAG: hypothetical protein ACOX4F_03625 [Atopobiaceae bacterium]